MPFKALSRFSLYVGLLLGFVLVFCPPLGMPPAISSNLFCWTIRAIIYTHQRAAGEARASVRACTPTSTYESLLCLDACKRPTLDHRHTDIQTHNHSRSRALSRQYSTLDSKPVKRDMCASVCACTESRPPSPPFPSHAHADQTHQTPQDPFFSASTPDSVDFICSKRCADFP